MRRQAGRWRQQLPEAPRLLPAEATVPSESTSGQERRGREVHRRYAVDRLLVAVAMRLAELRLLALSPGDIRSQSGIPAMRAMTAVPDPADTGHAWDAIESCGQTSSTRVRSRSSVSKPFSAPWSQSMSVGWSAITLG